MPPRLWQAIAVTIGILLLATTALDAAGAIFGNAALGVGLKADPTAPLSYVVTSIKDRSGIQGTVHVGDRIHLEDASAANRFAYYRGRRGDRFAFAGTTPSGSPTRFVATMVPTSVVPPAFWVYQLMRIALVLVGLTVAVRRPADEVARAMVALFLGLAAVISTGAPYLPVWLIAMLFAMTAFCQVFVVWAAVQLAVVFPKRSERGLRRWLARMNTPFLALCLVTLSTSLTLLIAFARKPPVWLQGLGIAETVLYYAAIAAAFVIGGRGASGADAKRVQWIAWTLAAGFSGPLVGVTLLLLKVRVGPWFDWMGATILAVPFGLGYAIVRHRVVDIGFVVNRALVFGGVSAIVVVAFGVLEWVLSNVFVRVSHITSTSLELALALGLGFSLRTIHSKVDHVVDDLFFRDRHAAERALRTFAREVSYVTDPHVAVARAHAELTARTGAASATLYVVDARAAVRVDPAESAAPDSVDIDDAALVRLRATRAPLKLRETDTALRGEWAFPMCVRDAVTGVVVLGPKTNGEAYAPDEVATIEVVALALGNALDALQTAALKAEVARVLLDGAPLETLRHTVDAASWARGVTPQPAGSLPGLTE